MELHFPEGNLDEEMTVELQNVLYERMKKAVWAIEVKFVRKDEDDEDDDDEDDEDDEAEPKHHVVELDNYDPEYPCGDEDEDYDEDGDGDGDGDGDDDDDDDDDDIDTNDGSGFCISSNGLLFMTAHSLTSANAMNPDGTLADGFTIKSLRLHANKN